MQPTCFVEPRVNRLERLRIEDAAPLSERKSKRWSSVRIKTMLRLRDWARRAGARAACMAWRRVIGLRMILSDARS